MSFEKVWNDIADNKPESMTMDEYKNYILGFVFYRYICFNQENHLAKNNLLDVKPNQTINDAFKEQANGDELEEYLEDISKTFGYAIEPDDTWATLIGKIQNETIVPSDFQNIFEHFNKNIKLNPEMGQTFCGIFDDVKIADTRLGEDTNSRAKTLCEIVKNVDEMSESYTPSELFKKLIENFANCAGKVGGKFYTPEAVSRIMAEIVASGFQHEERVFTVYDPCCGSGSTLLELTKAVPNGNQRGVIKFFGEEKELTTYNLARMNLIIHGVSSNNMVLKNADTLGEDWPDGMDRRGNDNPRKVDAIVSDIEFSKSWNNAASRLKEARFKDYGKLAPKSTADFAFLLHGLYHLDEKGTMAIVVPHGVLFRGNAEGTIRENLINIENAAGNKIDAVIGLPGNIMFSEKGKPSVPVVILVLKQKRENSDILFIDASHEYKKGKNKNYLDEDHISKIVNAYKDRVDIPNYAKVVEYDAIKDNGFNLNIPRYIESGEKEPELDPLEIINQINLDEAEVKAANENMKNALIELGLIKPE